MHGLSPEPSQESRTGQARRRLPGRRARWSHFALACLLVLISLPVLAGAALVLRLWIRPLDVTDTARRLLARSGAAQMTMGRVRLAWAGWRGGPTAPIDVMVDDLAMGDDHARHVAFGLDLRAALLGRIGLDTVSVEGAELDLRRTPAGRLALRSSPGGSAARAGSARPAGGAPPLDLEGLRLIALHDVHVTLAGLPIAAGNQTCAARIADLSLDPLALPGQTGEARFPAGRLDTTLSCGSLSLGLHGEGRAGPAGPTWRIQTGTLLPRDAARLWPGLAPLAGLGTPLRLRLSASDWRPAGSLARPRHLVLDTDLAAGRVSVAPDDPGVALREGTLHLSLDLDGPHDWQATGGGRLVLEQDATPLSLGVSAASHTGAITARLHVGLAHVEFATLGAIWPAPLAKGGRRWVTTNITSGHGRDLSADLALASPSGWDGLALTSLSGGVVGDDLTLHWLRPIAPLQHMDAVLRFEGPDALDITSQHAVEEVAGHGRLDVGPTRMRITGLSQKDQLGLIDTRIGGDLGDLLALLAHPRLRLLSRNPVSFTAPSGQVHAHLTLSLPLTDKVRADDIPIRVEASLARVHLGQVAAGRDLDDAVLSLTASNDGLAVQGKGRVGDVPTSLRYERDFRAGNPQQVVESAHASGVIDDDVLQREGLDDAHRFSGSAGLELGYVQHRSGSGQVDLHLDLGRAAVDTPLWRKPAGASADAAAELGLQDGKLVSIGGVTVSGPALLVRAHAEVEAGRANVLVVERFVVGRSQGSGRLTLPPHGAPSAAQPLRVQLRGPTLDLVPFLQGGSSHPLRTSRPLQAVGQLPSGGGASPAPAQIVWQMDLAFDRLLISPTRSFTGVRASAEASGARIERAHLAVAGPTPVEGSMTSQGAARRLVVSTPDTGQLLAALGVAQRITGGALDLQGRLEDQADGVRLAARARIGQFIVHDAPLAARLVRDLSVYGFLMGAPQKQIVVTRFEIPFTLQGDTLRLTDAHASNAALGSTLRGTFDLARQTLDLRGTIVPSYLFNALPGRLPGIGHVFSPEKEGGLLAATLRITGPIAKPDIRVNPLALLAPGILRRLLFD